MRIIGNDPTKTRQTSAIASGTLPNGKPVVVNADGTVSVVSGSSVSEVIGSVVQFNPDENAFRSTFVYDTVNDKIILFYIDSESTNNYGAAIVGTVSGTSISFGTPTFFHSTNTGYLAAAFDEGAGKAVVFYANDSDGNKGTAKVATVSGTSISFGTANEFITNQFQWPWASYDSTAGKIVLGYRDNTTGYGRAVVVTTSGTSTSFGTFVTVDTNASYYFVTAYDSVNNKTLMFYGDSTNSRNLLVVGTVSGTSISFGSANVVTTGGLNTNLAIAVDTTNNRCVLLYRDSTNSNYGTAKVGTVSGTSVSFGSAVVYSSDNTYQNRLVYDITAGKVVLVYVVGATTYGKIRSATVSGTTLTLDTEATFNSGTTTWTGVGYDPDQGKVVVAFMANSAGNSFVYQTGYSSQNLTAENYIGTAKSGAADGDGVVVNTQGNVADISLTPYSVSGASYTNKSYTITEESQPYAMFFKSDGTKMYAVGIVNDTVYQYSLSTAWDVSTASYDSVSFSVSSQSSDPQAGLVFSSDGTKMYVGSQTGPDTIYQYTLSTAWDLSTASYASKSFTVSTQVPSMNCFRLNSDGTKMFALNGGDDTIYQYTLSTAYDISSASYASLTYTITEDTIPKAFDFNNDGTQLIVVGATNDDVFQYTLGTAYTINTASYDNVSLDGSSEFGNPHDVLYSSDGENLYVLDVNTDTVLQYSTDGGLTAGQSYYVQTDGTLSTTAGDPSVFAGTAVSATKLIVKG